MKRLKSKLSKPPDICPAPSRPQKHYVILAVLMLSIIALAMFVNRQQAARPTEAASPDPLAGQTISTNAAIAATAAKADLQKLKGKWLRPDGGYVLDIKTTDDSGKLDVSYFNPKPIHVAKAQATQEGNTTKVFIELQDVNYPGSTYTLGYVPNRDLLTGVYFQAVQQQSFEVYFERQQ